jgi:predicted helicase
MISGEPVGYLLRSQLALARVAWPASPDDLRPRRPARKPFPHVREAVIATVKGFEGTDRGQLRMACGTGKTLAAMWVAERLESTRTLVLVPSLSLLAQTLREWTASASQPFDYLAVCSDQLLSRGCGSIARRPVRYSCGRASRVLDTRRLTPALAADAKAEIGRTASSRAAKSSLTAPWAPRWIRRDRAC